MNERIFFLDDKDINWSFDGSNKPYYYLKTGSYGRTEYVDPFPCYSHPAALTLAEITRVEEAVNLPHKPKWFVLSHEGLSRTNGWATNDVIWSDYVEGKEQTEVPNPYIVLAGKRIPLMPAMTRYLVAHEYGHVVDYSLRRAMKMKEAEFKAMYAKLRGVDCDLAYGARQWHKNIGEIIANDIRIILLNAEEEFWPHEVERPDCMPALISWWFDRVDEFFPKSKA